MAMSPAAPALLALAAPARLFNLLSLQLQLPQLNQRRLKPSHQPPKFYLDAGETTLVNC